MKNNRLGRPPKRGESTLDGRMEIRIDAAEKAIYEEAARIAGMERSDWIRSVLNTAAKRLLKKKIEPS